MVASGHMVRYKVDYDFHPFAVGAFYEIFEFGNTCRYIGRNIGIYVVVVLDSIRRSGLPFHHVRVVALYAVSRIVGAVGVLDHACIPDVCHSHVGYASEYLGCDVVEFS